MPKRWIIPLLLAVAAAHSSSSAADDGAAPAAGPAAAARQIDTILARHWRAKHVEPNPPVTDEQFVRRAYLDLAGRIPTVRETEAFLADADPHKRESLSDQLLGGEGYVFRFFQVWADALRLQSKARQVGVVTGSAYAEFVKQSLRANKPYDRFVRELVTARGRAWENGAIGFYVRDSGMPLDHSALAARVFLGTRIECAQCHDHPFDPAWTQMKFYQTAAFTFGVSEGDYYGRIGLRDVFASRYRTSARGDPKPAEGVRGVVQVLNEIQGPFLPNSSDLTFKAQDLELPHDYQYDDAKPFDVVKPAVGFGNAAAAVPGSAPVEAYADWMISAENPRFTTVVTNRLWKALFGRALVEPLDDLKEGTAADVPELQAFLNRLMVDRHYDMKAFLAVLLRTRVYQAGAARAQVQPGEPYDFPGPLLRRMTAEQVYDSFVTLIRPSPDSPDPFAGEEGARAVLDARKADAMFRAFSPPELFDRALAAASALKDQARSLKELQGEIEAARRGGDKALAERLAKETEAIQRRKWQTIDDQVVIPMLSKLLGRPVAARPAGGRNAILDTIRAAAIPGFEPPPPARDVARSALAAGLREEAAYFGIPAADFDAYAETRLNQLRDWPRAADLESPAPRGHYLREFGQSDRETVDNANPEANVAQALLLMNSDLVPKALTKGSQLTLAVGRAAGGDAKEDAVYLAILSRRPTAAERQSWARARAKGLTLDDLAAALLNTRQFLFVQ